MHGADDRMGHRKARRRSNADDLALLGAIRRGETGAIATFITRMIPLLLDAARRVGIDAAERHTLVLEFLDDIVIQLAENPAPDSPAGFIITAFRRRLSDRARADATRMRHDTDRCTAIGGEQTVAETCSEYTRRSVNGPDGRDATDDSVRRVIAAFLEQLTAGCSDDDRRLLRYVSERASLHDAAAWLGISYDAAKQRITRLRSRLRRAALERIATLDANDRVIIVRLLVRAGVITIAPTPSPREEMPNG